MIEYKTISIRIPKDVLKKIKKIALEEHRSVNQQILLYLETQLKQMVSA